MKRLCLSIAVIAIVVGFALLVGCSGGGGGTAGGGGGGTTGTLRVAITDQGGYDAVVLAIKEIRAVPAGQEGAAEGGLPVVATFDPPEVIDIMQLAYRQRMLGENDLAPGDYTQLRLVLAPNVNGQDPVNYVILPGETEKLPLNTPSGQQSGLKINADFTIQTEMTTTLVLDFDPMKAIVHTGQGSNKYNLKPTGIRCTETIMVSIYGALAGTISPAEAWPTAAVEAVRQGETTAVATTNVNPDDGSFRIPLTAGSYFIRVTADGYDPLDTSLLTTPLFYTVVGGQDTAVGDLALTATAPTPTPTPTP
jgi:hypothetical protein